MSFEPSCEVVGFRRASRLRSGKAGFCNPHVGLICAASVQFDDGNEFSKALQSLSCAAIIHSVVPSDSLLATQATLYFVYFMDRMR